MCKCISDEINAAIRVMGSDGNIVTTAMIAKYIGVGASSYLYDVLYGMFLDGIVDMSVSIVQNRKVVVWKVKEK